MTYFSARAATEAPILPMVSGELQDNEFRLLADNLPTLCWIAGPDGAIVWYNRRWHEYCGTTAEEMEGWGWTSVHDPDVLPFIMERWTAAIATGEPFEQTFPLRGADGIFRPFLTRILPYRDAGGRIARWFGTNVDISEHHRVEQALRASEEDLRQLNQTLEDRVLRAVDDVASGCGAVAIGATDACEYLNRVSSSISGQRETLASLDSVAADLAAEQGRSARSSADALRIAEMSSERVKEGALVIGEAVQDFASLTSLVVQLGERIAQFSGAMHDVRQVTAKIDGLARTSRVLALNATIEAARSGSEGAAFAVVANEMKKLATSTSTANQAIEQHLMLLHDEAAAIITDLTLGVEQAETAQSRFGAVDDVTHEVARLADLVRDQANGNARSNDTVLQAVERVGLGLSGFIADAETNGSRLAEAALKVSALEALSNGMFDRLVAGGFSTEDQPFVKAALAARDQVQSLVESALDRGEITADDVFDTDYQLITGSAPPRYDNRFNAFADKHIQPLLDAVSTSDSRIEGAVCSDINGYLVTHQSFRSQQPKPGDEAWNDLHCRNRRILMDAATRRAIQSTAQFMMSVYQIDRGVDPVLIKSVYVPLTFRGRRWGNFEIGYC